MESFNFQYPFGKPRFHNETDREGFSTHFRSINCDSMEIREQLDAGMHSISSAADSSLLFLLGLKEKVFLNIACKAGSILVGEIQLETKLGYLLTYRQNYITYIDLALDALRLVKSNFFATKTSQTSSIL